MVVSPDTGKLEFIDNPTVFEENDPPGVRGCSRWSGLGFWFVWFKCWLCVVVSIVPRIVVG